MQEKKFKTRNLSKNSQSSQDTTDSLPPIPDKRYFTIGEAALLCGVKPHVLRYWEQEFLQLKPSKRRGNRRYYQHKDVLLVRQIRTLLYENGFTIDGARAQLLQSPAAEITPQPAQDDLVEKIIAELENLLQNLKSAEIVKSILEEEKLGA
jgi:DNA-binding transcriptional MerR regulator